MDHRTVVCNGICYRTSGVLLLQSHSFRCKLLGNDFPKVSPVSLSNCAEYNANRLLVVLSGVYSLLTLQLGANLEIEFFRIVGTIFSGFTATLWLAIFCKTIYLAYDGSIFHAPCLDDAPLDFVSSQLKQEDESATKADTSPQDGQPGLEDRAPSH